MNIERDKAFRRRNAKIKEKVKKSNKEYKPEKNWKMMYIRSVKLARAKQLGIEYEHSSRYIFC